MPFLYILGNFNKSTKPRVSKCRAALSRGEPRALPLLWMTSTSRQIAGAIWMPILFLEARLGLSLFYIVQDTNDIFRKILPVAMLTTSSFLFGKWLHRPAISGRCSTHSRRRASHVLALWLEFPPNNYV